MNRVGFYFCFKDGKGREFLLQNFLQQIDGKLLAFIMADISQ